MIKVSIVVPVYNVERYVKRCVDSLFSQSYHNIEYIFVDDCSPDASVKIIEEEASNFPNRLKQVRIIHNATNLGVSATRNIGVQNATGEYLLQVDSDDYLDFDAVSKLVDCVEFSDADVVLFGNYIVGSSDKKVVYPKYDKKDQYIIRLLHHTEQCAHWNKFYRMTFFNEANVSFIAGIGLGDDYAVTPRIIHKAKKVAVLNEALYYYETGNQSSYMHSLSNVAVSSLHKADKVLIDYFTSAHDKDKYQKAVSVIEQRSMVSLMKSASRDSREMILKEYSDCIQKGGRGLSLVNKFVFELAVRRWNTVLSLFLHIYRFFLR